MLEAIDKQKVQEIALATKNPGLFAGSIGIAFSVYSENELGNKDFDIDFADNMLKNAMANVADLPLLNLHSGISGIGLAIQGMVRRQYVEGDADKILEDIDNRIFKECCSTSFHDNDELLVELLYYLSARLKSYLKIKDRSLYVNLARNLMNRIYFSIDKDFFKESKPSNIFYRPYLFMSALSNFLETNLFNERIMHIWIEFSELLAGSIPFSNLGCLSILLGINKMNARYLPSVWKEIVPSIECRISYRSLFSSLLDKQILLSNGLLAAFYILRKYNSLDGIEKISIDKRDLTKRIRLSSIWTDVYENPSILTLQGYFGCRLAICQLNSEL